MITNDNNVLPIARYTDSKALRKVNASIKVIVKQYTNVIVNKYFMNVTGPRVSTEGFGSVISSSCVTYNLTMEFLIAERIVHANAFIPAVSEKISIINPAIKPIIIIQFWFMVSGKRMMTYMNMKGVATFKMLILLHTSTCIIANTTKVIND